MKIRNKNTIEEAIAIIVLIATKKKAVVGLVFYMPGQNYVKNNYCMIILTTDETNHLLNK